MLEKFIGDNKLLFPYSYRTIVSNIFDVKFFSPREKMFSRKENRSILDNFPPISNSLPFIMIQKLPQ